MGTKWLSVRVPLQSHIQTIFYHRNNYLLWVINKVTDDTKKISSTDQSNYSSNDIIHCLIFSYQGDTGSNLLKSMKRQVSKHVKLEIMFNGRKLN